MNRKWFSVATAAAAFGLLFATVPANAQKTPTPAPPAPTAPAMGTMPHKMPMRDAKGRFMKATPMPGAMATPAPRKMPMRDAKGRFMKASPKPAMGAMATPAPTKKLPMRDAKGRFMKATPTPGAMPKP